MALAGFWAVLYYGIFASVTGGWLPIRAKNPWLVVFHLYLFLSFITFPLTIYLIGGLHWSGWLIYCILVVASFLVLKVYNLRLHRALGEDPPEEEEEEKESDEGEREREENGDSKDNAGEREAEKAAEAAKDRTVPEVEITDAQEDEILRRKRDSANSLNQSSSYNGTVSLERSVELQGVSTETTESTVANLTSGSVTAIEIESELKDEVLSPLETAVELTHPPLDEEMSLPTTNEGFGVVSPAENAAPTELLPEVSIPGTVEDTHALQTPPLKSTTTSLSLSPIPSEELLVSSELPLVSPAVTQAHLTDTQPSALMSPVHRSNSNIQAQGGNIDNYISILASFNRQTNGEGASVGLQRSTSMPPSMFEHEPRRDRARVCVRQGRRVDSLRTRYEGRRFRSSRSEDHITNEEEEEGDILSSMEHTYPRYRRQVAFRRSHSADVASHTRVAHPPSPLLGAADDDPTPEEENPMIESVKQKLLDDGHLTLLDVVDKMPKDLHEAILLDSVPTSSYETFSSRAAELRQGHLAAGEADATRGAVHWFEVSGEWDFYVFHPEGEEPLQPPVPPHRADEDLLSGIERLHQELLFHYGLDLDDLVPASPPLPPPRPHRPPLGGEEEAEEQRKLTFEIIPGLKRTTIPLNFRRRQLEDFMDRNVTWLEAGGTIVLAVLVCIIAALLLDIGFYNDFWVFWFCFVIGTAHFSLIKSVQDDPASPIPGQNHTTALSRAIYFIVVGILALGINAAVDGSDFDPLCVYGFDINSRSVLVFVRDGLLIFILFFPVLFAFGWLPQADTLTILLIEQVDMHVFGGTASTGLVCAFYALLRSVLVAAILWPLGYAAFTTLESDQPRLTCASTNFEPNDPGGDCDVGDRIALSFFLGVLFAASFSLSRATSNHQYLMDLLLQAWKKLRDTIVKKQPNQKQVIDFADPLQKIYSDSLRLRLLSDLLAGIFIFVFVTGLNLSTLFCLSEVPAYVVYSITCVLGVFNHYLLPHIRKEMPWICCSEPIIKAREWDTFEVSETPKISVVERILQVSTFLEKNVFYPLTFLYAFNLSALHYKARFGDYGAAVVLSIAGMKIIRSAFTELSRQHVVLIFTLFFFHYDYAHLSEGLPLDYFIIAILFNKVYDLLLKLFFIYIYIAPWQTSWSSPGHIIIQPLLIPHCPVIFFQTLIASIVSAPINPVVASTLFILSYVRPIKYWEKNYNTKRSDSSNTRLDTQLEGSLRNPNPDRLDSLFYEHLTWVLQKSLCGDLLLGRWGRVTSGDFFILTSDRLNALVHIIEFGNGFVTFQLRGLEFRGTYCHQREVEAITESMSDDEGCCCYEPGHLPFMLSCNKAFSSRWMAWEVVSSCYTLHGYSISENQAHLVFNSYDYKRNYITNYTKCIIYKLISSPKLRALLENEQVREALEPLHNPFYVDLDALFDESRNCDYSHAAGGISRARFVDCFHPFIRVCVGQQEGLEVDSTASSFLVTLSFAYSLLGRRMFFQHAQSGASRRGGDNFMNGLYRMFLGDARPNSPNDEWVFTDVDSIQDIIIPASRLALKVHQDNFTFSEEYESPMGIYETIRDVEENHIVTHENDREWRNAVVMNKPSLLALRYQRTEDSYIYPYKLIRLTSKFIKFRVVKLNRESVRGLWTSQQHELIFLRNSDSERGSIQNHKPTLRNMVNSSMDLPIGYPIYVSPLQTSFVERHETYNNTLVEKISNPLEIAKAVDVVRSWCESCIKHYRGSRGQPKGTATAAQTSAVMTEGSGGEAQLQHSSSVDSLTGMQYGAEGGKAQSYEDPFPDSDSDSEELLWKPMWVSKLVEIADASQVFENFNANWLKWPDNHIAQKATKSAWKSWRPVEGMEGEVVHEWRPFHIDPVQRSHIDKVILLVKMTEDYYVLVKELGVKEI